MIGATALIVDNPVTMRGNPLAWADLLKVPDELERIAKESGIPVGPGNRVDRYRRLIAKYFVEEPGGIQIPTDQAAKGLLCAGAELRGIRFILSQLSDKPKWRSRLGSIFAGAEHLHEDRNHGPRSTQAELYCAARLAWMGLGVEPSEPDIVVTWENWRFGVAVKRLRSEAQYHKRLNEGFEQVRRSKLPGMVAVDLTHLLWFDQKPLFVNHPEGLSIVTVKMLQEFVFEHHARPMPMRRDGLPFGAIYFATMAARGLPEGHAQFCTGHIFVALCVETDPRKNRVLRLNRLLHRQSVRDGDSIKAVPMM